VVVLPAPFGPNKPTTSPRATLNEILSIAVLPLYFLVNLTASIIGVSSIIFPVQGFYLLDTRKEKTLYLTFKN
jgi:hypothetical protein